MESNENQLGSYYHYQPQQVHLQHQLYHHQQQTTTITTSTVKTSIAPSTTASPTNGVLPNAEGSHTVYPHSLPSVVSSHLEPVKRKRGRPRKYGTPEQALAAKKAAAATASLSSHSYSSKSKKDRALATGSASAASFIGTNKKSHSFSLGQGFTPHVLCIAANEDVGQKIMMFMQQSKRELCILSASGSISNASLRQPATSGGNVTYEGCFDIISLSGSYVRTELGGRTGGLSVCMSSTDGQIIGGGVGGPLKAAGPVQVIIGTFLMDTKKNAGVKGASTGNKLPVQIKDESISNVVDSSGAVVRGNEDHQAVGASHFMIQSQSVQVISRPTDWRDHADAGNTSGFELSGRGGHGAQHFPENGDYDQIQD